MSVCDIAQLVLLLVLLVLLALVIASHDDIGDEDCAGLAAASLVAGMEGKE